MVNLCSHENLYTDVHNNFIYNNQTGNKPNVLPLVNSETKCYAPILKNMTAILKTNNKLLIRATTWMDLEVIVLKEKSQTQRLNTV